MRALAFGVLLVSLVTLLTELVLTRVLDVLFYPNMSYLVVTSAIFGFGLAGALAAIWTRALARDPRDVIPAIAAVLALLLVLIRPAMNRFPFNFYAILRHPAREIIYFGVTYLALLLPFVASGLIVALVFSAYAGQIRRLYFWDLTGAAIGSVILIPLIKPIGPGGLLVVAAAAALLASALFGRSSAWRVSAFAAAVLLAPALAFHTSGYLRFDDHLDKRGVKSAREAGKIERTVWDPIARIDVVNEHPLSKHVAYDGGSQSTYFVAFDGDFDRLGRELRNLHPDSASLKDLRRRFWRVGVLASHYLKRDSGAEVLVIGSAGGQETVAALGYGASRVDAVEMVRTVVDLRTGPYASFIGNVFGRPEVRNIVAEGRSYLRSTSHRYDIIQIFSNYTSSSIASGGRAMSPIYLQTAEAYREYFGHLKPDGILQINDHGYPRAVTTAALAWRRMGRSHFRDHVLVFERDGVDHLPTLLIQMQPWTEAEIRELEGLFALPFGKQERLVENPFRPEDSFLGDAFYSGRFPATLARSIPYQVSPTTDDHPFFSSFRKSTARLHPDPRRFVNPSMAAFLNAALVGGIPLDWVHFFGVGVLSILFAAVLVVVPLSFSRSGLGGWTGRGAGLTYFSALGAGFIIIEIIFIQLFIRLIGSPAHSFSVVIFTLLLAAGTGSLASEKLGVGSRRSWMLPFFAILLLGVLDTFVVPILFDPLLGLPLVWRCVAAGLLIYPLGFFLGMPFPLGILALRGQPRSAVAWAWGMNGLFTVIGGLASALLSLVFGFKATMIVALAIYSVALIAYRAMGASLAAASAAAPSAAAPLVSQVR